ncbi:MAG: hypothetical protein ACXABH_05250 [Candidatus Thorarchaeota archaeon]
MKRRKRALLPISLLITVCLVTPVSAFYFDFQYFETDKLVYEVGETINMVAKLIADFSHQGWCHVSFAVVTDLGPAFADEYYIQSSPDVRYLNSTYTILPEHTAPNTTGIQAFVLFNAEIFDTVSQGAGDNIEITITRGHLSVSSLTSLSVQSGIDTSLKFRVESIHNSSIIYADESVALHIENSSFQTVFDNTTTTNDMGLISLNWNDTLGSPGTYNLTMSSIGNEDFLPFSKSFQITVLPALSNLTLVSSPTSIHCQSPDGSYFDQADIIVNHTSLNLNPLNDSLVLWETSFSSGQMTNHGNGQYSITIPFQTSPGNHTVNITATNPQYQPVQKEVLVDVLANSLQFSQLQPSWNVTRGQNVSIGLAIDSEIDWNQSVRIQFNDESNEFSLESDFYPGITSYLEIQTSSSFSIGLHNVNVSIDSEYYEFQNQPQIILGIIGTLNMSTSIDSAFYGESLNFSLIVFDDANDSISLVNIFAYCDGSMIPFTVINNTNPNTPQSLLLPSWISPGIHNITISIEGAYYLQINQTIIVQVWMRTNITIVITSIHDSILNQVTAWRSSSGSIIRPPPILRSGTTSTEPLTARSTSLDN